MRPEIQQKRTTIFQPQISEIFKLVCDYYEISIDDANTPSRKSALAKCRQVAHYISYSLTGKPFAMIGHVIGHKNHATVMNSCRVIKSKIEPLKNGVIPDNDLYHEVSILMYKAKNMNKNDEERLYASMGTMITNQN